MRRTSLTRGSGGLVGAADRIRETAKWLTVSLAAIGGILVAGTQLSDIGALEPGSRRFSIGIIAAVVAAAGSAIVLWATTSTATAPAVSLTNLSSSQPPAGTRQALNDASLCGVYRSIAELKTTYEAALRQRRSDYEAWLADPQDPQKVAAVKRADADAVSISNDVGILLEVAAYQALSHRWGVNRWWMMGGAALAAGGIGIFAWAANPPGPATASVVAPGLLKTPTEATVQLTSQGEGVLRGRIGKRCGTPLKVLVLGTADAGPDLLVEQAGCAPTRFVLLPSWGSVTVMDH